MTQPTMATLARKAPAIVTNEGGVTSHPSIIARELNIPCGVGAKECRILSQTYQEDTSNDPNSPHNRRMNGQKKETF